MEAQIREQLRAELLASMGQEAPAPAPAPEPAPESAPQTESTIVEIVDENGNVKKVRRTVVKKIVKKPATTGSEEQSTDQ